MNLMKNVRRLALLLGFALAACREGDAQMVVVDEQRSLDAGSCVRLHLQTDISQVLIGSGENADTINVHVTVAFPDGTEEKFIDGLKKSFTWDARIDGADCVINAFYRPDQELMTGGKYVSPSIVLDVVVPSEMDCTAETAEGDIQVKAVNGRHVLNSKSGNLELETSKTRLDAKTRAGDIVLKGVNGVVRAGTSSGDIRVTESQVEGELSATSGSITVHDAVRGMKAVSKSGDVAVSFAESPTSACVIKTESGDAEVFVSSGVSLRVQARSKVGEIHLDCGGRQQEFEDTCDKDFNGGGQTVSVSTKAGDIRIESP